jgi:hypothetical protein
MNSTRPAATGSRRPWRSPIGPQTSCPTLKPARKAERVSCTSAGSARNATASAGIAGRYRSVEIDENAIRALSTIKVRNRPTRGFGADGPRRSDAIAG